MPIRYEHVESVGATPERVFAVIDDLPLTAEWLPPCVSLEKVGPGPNAPGDKLRYVYKQGGRQGEMAGEIRGRTPGERLHCLYFDRMFDVSVDLRVAAAPDGTLTTHIIEITPKTLMGKMMGPLIGLGLGKRTRGRRQPQEAARIGRVTARAAYPGRDPAVSVAPKPSSSLLGTPIPTTVTRPV